MTTMIAARSVREMRALLGCFTVCLLAIVLRVLSVFHELPPLLLDVWEGPDFFWTAAIMMLVIATLVVSSRRGPSVVAKISIALLWLSLVVVIGGGLVTLFVALILGSLFDAIDVLVAFGIVATVQWLAIVAVKERLKSIADEIRRRNVNATA